MALRSIRNHRAFFSDYWLGTVLGRPSSVAPRLTAGQVRKSVSRLTRLVDGAAGRMSSDLTKFREGFARPLLADLFGFKILEATDDPKIRPLAPISDEDFASPVALLALCPDPEEVESRQLRKRLEDHLISARQDYAFMISPETLRLVRRPGLGPRGATFELGLASTAELQDAESLAAAYRVLSAGCFVPSGAGTRPIDLLEAESRQHSARVSEELKAAVFLAAEKMVAGFLLDIRERASVFLPRPGIEELRDAGFLALYRILFILYAEARDERLLYHRLYRQSYSLDSLVTKLLMTSHDRLAANRFAIWAQIEACFKVFNEGIEPSLPDLENIPPRGGRLFSEQTPEGGLLLRLRLDDRVAAAILIALATTRPRRAVGRERVSFRELEIEQLGSVYEGLLEYEPSEAKETLAEVRISNRNLALTPDELVRLCEQKNLKIHGEASIVEGTSAEHLHPEMAGEEPEELANSDAEPESESELEEEEEENAWDEDSGTEADDVGKIDVARGATIRLVRRLEAGDFFFRPGSARKSSGSYYTPTPMVDYVVREALAPLAKDRSSAEIQRLRVIDLACGSAHFLVGAARFLGAKLFEAFHRERGAEPPPQFYPDRPLTSDVRSRWETEGPAWCKRRIVEHCLFGVDLNPSAVQLAQVALWIESLAGDRPLSFFAHHIRPGNSLLGTRIASFDLAPDQRLASRADMFTRGLFEAQLRKMVEQALEERRLIDSPLPPEIRGDTPEEYAYKEDRLRRADESLAQARLLLDLRSASPLLPEIWRDLPMLAAANGIQSAAGTRQWWRRFEEIRARERFFHWELEFPEVLLDPDRPGFDAVIGNPPWDKMLPSKHEFYSKVDVLIRTYKGNDLEARIRELHAANPALAAEFAAYRERATTLARYMRNGGDFPLAEARSQAAHEDVAKYFVDRAFGIVREGGAVGLVVPSVLYNGDGWVGIRRHLLEEMTIERFYGFENRKKIFPIDSRYKFANIVARKKRNTAGGFTAAFMRHDVSELEQTDRKPWNVWITRDEIARLSPDTMAFLEYRSPRDQEIVAKMYAGCPTLGGLGHGNWGARLVSWRAHEAVFNSAEDKDLFTDPVTGRLFNPPHVLGDEPADVGVTIERMRERGFWPVFEGKHIEQFLVGIKPVRWWLSTEQARSKYQREPWDLPTLVFRETASNTNERTCIAAVLPAQSAAAHSLTALVVEKVDAEKAAVVLNSLCFDYALRFRTAGTHVSFTYILPMPVPSADAVAALPTVGTRLAWQAGLSHVTGDVNLWPALWSTNRAVAEAYGLNAEDFAHILSSFPVFARKRREFYAFLMSKLTEWRGGRA